jgi:hypothetical protein
MEKFELCMLSRTIHNEASTEMLRLFYCLKNSESVLRAAHPAYTLVSSVWGSLPNLCIGPTDYWILGLRDIQHDFSY